MVKRIITVLLMLTLVFVSSVTPVFAEQGSPLDSGSAVMLDAIADRNPGDRVTISGTTMLDEITIRVISPKNIVLYVNTTKDTVFTVSFALPTDAEYGEYQVVAGAGQEVSTKTFHVHSQEQVKIISIDKIKIDTVAGTTPVLPSLVIVRYSDGSTKQLSVAWSAIEPSKYASVGTFNVEGTVVGTDIKAIAEVTVTVTPAAVVLDAIADRNPGDRVTISGTTILDEITIRVISPQNIVLYVDTTKYANFSVSFILPNDAKLGEYQVVAGLGEIVSTQKFNVLSQAQVKIISIDKVAVTTNAGKAPALPPQVTVRYSDGSTKQLSVVWSAIEPSKYASAGTFVVEGTVVGTDIKAIAEVTVTDDTSPVIISIDKVAVTTNAGKAPALPPQVTVRYSDGSTKQLSVVWSAIEPSKYASAGTFDVEGTVEGTNIKAIAKVTVTKDTSPVIISIDKVAVTTNVGTAPKLPSQVTVRYSDGSTKKLSVVWSAIEPSKYASAGTFDVEGTVVGTNIKAIATITVIKKQDSGDSGGGSGGSSRIPTPTPTPAPGKPEQPEVGNGNINFNSLKPNELGQVSMTLDETIIKRALEDVTADSSGIKTVTVNASSVSDANEYRLTVPTMLVSSDTPDTRVNLVTGIGTVELPSNMFSNIAIKEDEITISIAAASTEGMSEELAEAIGDRPVIELSVFAGGERISWDNVNAPVRVTFKYEPTNIEEVRNSEFITIWYIDGEGNVVPVTNAKYDPETGEVSFTTTHFSKFAVVYVLKTFSDLNLHPWAKHEIEVLASKGIINGISAELYDPVSNITRADFLKLLISTLDLHAEVTDNFTDVNADEYYYETVGIAKALGIVNGVGDGRFEPKTTITRQDMMVMVNRALDVAQKPLVEATDINLLDFDDVDKIADYAKESVEALIKSGIIKGSNNNVNPRGNTTRAEAAVVLYRLYNN